MKRRIVLAIGIVGLAAIAGLFFARAQERGWRSWHNRGAWGWRNQHSNDLEQFSERMVAFLSRRLNLTDDQQAQINQIISAERPAIEPLVEELAQASQQLRAASADEQFDESKVRGLAAQQSQAIAELIVAKERVKSKVFAVLTPEQRTQATKMLEHFSRGLRFGAGLCLGRVG